MPAISRTVDAAPEFRRFPLLTSHDVDEVRQKVSHLFCEHRLQLARGTRSLDTRVYFRPGRKVGCGRMLYGATVDIDPGQLDDFYLLQIPLRGAETIILGRDAWLSTPAIASLVSPGVPFRMRHEDNAEKLFLRIDRAAIESQYRQLHGQRAPRAITFAPTIDFSTRTGQALRALLEWHLREASDGSALEHPLVSAQAEETLLLTLLHHLPHNQPEPGGTPAITPGYVRRAEDFILAHAHEALTASRIAEDVGVSTRSLFAGFRRYRNTSPLQYLREVRLDQVHAELAGATDPALRITAVALRWGFGHLGQFSAAYRQRHGELPSATLQRRLGRLPSASTATGTASACHR